ncbi:MAG: glycosyltransferase family 39 protein [Inconstantimicrobium porci]|nr:glycosyltransferase family 39 protein [Inconstantimicrobium porci]MDY5911655.1 glycosyltransferase family 39 protein [Inconstantimicrobium porci]
MLSAVLNIGNLGLQGYGNQYYAAGVKSMTMSLKNFFFVSFDPSGFVSIDKPPLGFWIQAVSAKIFGVNSWGLLLPQAVAGVISVGILYMIVKRAFGKNAGLISALCMAVTPIFVAASKNNTIDNLLVLALLLACLLLSKAAENGKTKTLIFSLVLVGIGFNIKMLQAYMILPAMYLAYLVSKNLTMKRKVINLACGTLVLAVVSLSWAFVVDMVPPSNRPFVGSSTNNTVMELIFGHNGIERFTTSLGGGKPGLAPSGKNGKMERPDGNMNQNNSSTDNKIQNDPGKDNYQNQPQGNNMPQGMGNPPDGMDMKNMKNGNHGGVNSNFGGSEEASILRLFSSNGLSDQISYLIPLALIGFIASILCEKSKKTMDNKKRVSLTLWFMWFLPVFIFFSYTTGTFHPYYLTMLAAPISALTGIGLVSMWRLYKENKDWMKWLLPAALGADGALEILLLSYNFDMTVAKILIVIIAVITLLSAAVLCIFNVKNDVSVIIKKKLIMAAVTGLLITPLVCSSVTLFKTMQGTFPSAGLSLLSSREGMGVKGDGNMKHQMGMMEGNNQPPMNDGATPPQNNSNSSSKNNENNQPSNNNNNTDGIMQMMPDSNNNDGKQGEPFGETSSSMIKYLQQNKGNAKYLLIAQSSNSLANIILQTGENVMALGGFSGNDNIITLDQFKTMVKNGEVRFAMTSGQGGAGNNEIMNWIKQNGKAVESYNNLYDLKDAVK